MLQDLKEEVFEANLMLVTEGLVRLTSEEVAEDCETNTGIAIAECFSEKGINPMEMAACFQKSHAPFTWVKNAIDSVKNSVALEVGAQMAMGTWSLNADQHHLRRHGAGARTTVRADLRRRSWSMVSQSAFRHIASAAGRRHLSLRL